jgi:ribonuclease D
MPGRLITTQDAFDELCEQIVQSGIVAFDTEFVSEFYYRPRLCLMQFAIPGRVVAVDPFGISRLDRWWGIMADDRTTIIVHGGREEVRFCLRFAGQLPNLLVDVQVAEGLLSRGFPLGYKALVSRELGRTVESHETRTDWSRRPLSSQQVDYAMEDVAHLLEVWQRQQAALAETGRTAWARHEFAVRMADVAAEDDAEAWRRLSGVQRLSRREMAIVRELYEWREREARTRDKPPRSILRDDFLIDLARRKPKRLQDVTATRGMQRRDHHRYAEDLFGCVQRALKLPEENCPRRPPSDAAPPQEELLAKLLGLALADRCAELGISQTIVGTMADLQALVRWHAFDRGEPPRLMQGWRAEVCGQVLTDLLDGRLSLRVLDPRREAPLCYEPVEQNRAT